MAVQVPPLPRHGRAGTATAAGYGRFNDPNKFLEELLTTFRQFPTDNSCVPVDMGGYTMYTYTYLVPGETTPVQMATTQQMSRAEALQWLRPGSRITGVDITRRPGLNFWIGIDRETETNSVAITASDRLNQTKAAPFRVAPTSVFSNPRLLRTALTPVLGKCRTILFPLTLLDTDGEAHANLIIMHQIASNEYDIERWDPWQIGGSMPALERDLARFFGIVLRPMGFYPFFLEMAYTCPEATFGLQTLVYIFGEDFPECRQLLALNPEGICTLWTFVYAVLRIYQGNADRTPREINDHLKRWAKHDLPGLCRFASSFAATLIRARDQ